MIFDWSPCSDCGQSEQYILATVINEFSVINHIQIPKWTRAPHKNQHVAQISQPDSWKSSVSLNVCVYTKLWLYYIMTYFILMLLPKNVYVDSKKLPNSTFSAVHSNDSRTTLFFFSLWVWKISSELFCFN